MKPTLRTLRTVFAAIATTAGRAWTALRGLARAVRSRRRQGGAPSTLRRRYVFGGISRKTFDAAMRKPRLRRSRTNRAV
jgi:hypothetical protein